MWWVMGAIGAITGSGTGDGAAAEDEEADLAHDLRVCPLTGFSRHWDVFDGGRVTLSCASLFLFRPR